MDRRKIYPLYMVIAPALVFIVLFVIPSTIGYVYAFTNWSAARSSNLRFVGLENIISVIQNRKLPVALVNTLIYAAVKTVTVTVLGLFFAYLLNREIRTRMILRTVYYIPVILSALVVGLTFSAVFETRHGVINEIIRFFGGEAVQWFGGRFTAVIAICAAEVWRNTGYAIVISLTGMQSVSPEYLEAARIDGASEWQSYRIVTLPLIMSIVNVNILFSLIYGLKMFDLIYIMTSGGPGNSTESFGTLMMNEMAAGRYAQSVSVNLVFTLVLVAVSVCWQKISEMWEYTE
ncbi:MAG: sugar ABC transporter permease [Treponema sp.]|jgi:raffinose/stachyose/melibiose transport system permease protein|nr:sugar ABC transporter permease [Treponema sp.]